MKKKFLAFSAAMLVFVLAISVGAGVSKAQYGQAAPAQPAQGPPAPAGDKGDKGKLAPVVNKAEEDAYKAFFAAVNGGPVAVPDKPGAKPKGNAPAATTMAPPAPPQTQLQLGEDFVAKFPQSHYLPGVYSMLTTIYFNLGQEDKMFEVGTKAVELNPDNVDVLALLAMAVPRRVKATMPDAQQQYKKAEEYAHHAIELIPNLTKPDTIDDAAFEKAKNEKLSMAHSGLGLIDIQHSKFEDAKKELELAVKLASSPDPVDYYLLGNADVQASYYNDAVTAYGKCSESGPLTAQCKARAESAKKDATTKMGR